MCAYTLFFGGIMPREFEKEWIFRKPIRRNHKGHSTVTTLGFVAKLARFK